MTQTATTPRNHELTQAQIDACRRVDDGDGHYHYEIESASEPGAFYTARYNEQYRRWADNCKACREGVPCWHLRVVNAIEAAEADAAQYEEEQALRREIEAVKRDGLKAYERKEFSLFR